MASGPCSPVLASIHRLLTDGTLTGLSESQLLERFLTRGDEAAFEAILRRHGPMVLGVCRRLLSDPNDVEDAFQATFLVLVRKAGSIRDRGVLGTWLYGVARRVAVRARVDARRRRAREWSDATEMARAERWREPEHGAELRGIIDEEVSRLTERYRAALVLCDLEGYTHEQAAVRLRCPVGTVKSRLARAHEKLRSRLARRGLAPSAELLATTLAPEPASAVGTPLVNSTIAAAIPLAAGRAVTVGTASAAVAALVEGTPRSMNMITMKLAAAVLTAAGVIAAGAGVFAYQAPGNPPAGAAIAPRTKVDPTPEAIASREAANQVAAVPSVDKERPRPVVRGQVVGPNGKPHEGAEVVVVASRFRWRSRQSDKPTTELLGRGRCDGQGRFRIELSGEPESDEGRVVLVAIARDHGFAARELTDLDATIEGPIRLPAEQPVEVRLVDLEGSPVAGAEVRPAGVYPDKEGAGLSSDILSRDFLPPLFQRWTSDRDGRFALRGYGPDHSAFLEVRAPGFGKQDVQLAIKAGVGTSTLTIGRVHIVEGRVALGKDGPPAVGARIEARTMSEKYGIGMRLGDDEVTTDKEGRYRIDAAPGASIVLKVFPPREGADAYLIRGELVVPGDSVRSRVDFALPKGVLVRGRVIEAGTGRPVAGAIVHHQAQERNNPYFIKGNPDVFNPDEQKVVTAADGTFRLGIMPGPGYLLVKGPTAHYLHEEIPSVELAGQIHWPNTRTYPDALRKLSPKPDEGPVDVEFPLRRGVTVRGHLVDPGGQPVREALLVSRWYLSRNGMTVDPTWKSLRGGRFELDGCDPGSSATVLFLDAKNQRGAAIKLSGKQDGEDITVTMKPCGSARVRILNDQGKPVRAGREPAHLEVVLSPGASWGDLLPSNQTMTSPLMADSIHASNLDVDRYRDTKTDANGRMTFPTLIPGATYRVIVFNQKEKTEIEFTVEPGEAKDLGDLKIRNLEHAG
jgi:RNA polymerase sigma factor (sigma-70 family)